MAHIRKQASHATDTTRFEVIGDVDAEQVLDALIPFLEESPTQLVEWDLGQGSLRTMQHGELRRIVETAGPLSVSRSGGRTAIICLNDVDYGLSRMFKAYAELAEVPFQIEVFRDRAVAREWLRQGD